MDHTEFGIVVDHGSNEALRPATEQEWRASVEAARRDAGAGVINVNGRHCFVEGGPGAAATQSELIALATMRDRRFSTPIEVALEMAERGTPREKAVNALTWTFGLGGSGAADRYLSERGLWNARSREVRRARMLGTAS